MWPSSLLHEVAFTLHWILYFSPNYIYLHYVRQNTVKLLSLNSVSQNIVNHLSLIIIYTPHRSHSSRTRTWASPPARGFPAGAAQRKFLFPDPASHCFFVAFILHFCCLWWCCKTRISEELPLTFIFGYIWIYLVIFGCNIVNFCSKRINH